MSDQGDKQSTSHSAGARDASEPFFDACKAAIRDEIPGLLAGLFARIDRAREDWAAKAAVDDRYRPYADAMEFVGVRRAQVETGFLTTLEAGCCEAGMGLVASPATNDPDPLGAADLREVSFLNDLAAKAEIRYGAQLRDLRSRRVARGDAVTRPDPIGPRAVCRAFRSALEPLYGLNLSSKLVLYKAFDRQIMQKLDALYAGCLAHVEDHEFASSAATVTGTDPAGPISEAPDSAVVFASESVGESARTFKKLRRLLIRHRPHRARPPKGSRVPSGTLHQIMAGLEQELGVRSSGRSQAKLLRIRLRNELRLQGAGQALSLAPEDEDALDLVLLLFEHMFQEGNMTDRVKDSIGRLQIPIARLALEDKGFFDDPAHPARLLINRLVASTFSWAVQGEPGGSGIPDRVEKTVRGVLKGVRRDRRFYAAIDAELKQSIDDELKLARAAEELARGEMQGREDRSDAEAVVATLIDERLQAWRYVPEVVSSLVYDGWEQVMLAAYRDGGATGEPWQRAVSVLDRLLWSVQPKYEDDERRELMRGIPELLRTLREGLDRVSYDQQRVPAKFRELQAVHVTALRPAAQARGKESAPGGAGPPLQSVPRPGVAVKKEQASSQPESLRPRAAVFGLPIGTWLDLNRDGESERVKLAWRGEGSGIHLFVDRRGQKVLELSDKGLENLFAQGLATIVGEENSPIVDRAIESLVRTLEVA